MQNRITEDRILEAMARQEPHKPRRIELGGDYYFKCHWLKCDCEIQRWMDFCPKCGFRIDWRGV